MKIGEKIKKLRTEKLMTQSDLAGTAITRNMLSQIENGVARPSLETVQYLAMRLNVSPGYLLSEGNDEQIYLKYREIANIKRAYISEDYRICRDMCLHTDSEGDDEIAMIFAESCLEIGVEEFNAGNLRSACTYLDEAIEGCAATIYRTETILAKAGLYFQYMRILSATLDSNIVDDDEINLYPALTDDLSRYLFAAIRIDCAIREDTPIPDFRTFSLKTDGIYYLLLEAENWMREGNYASAFHNLHGLLMDPQAIAEPILYFLFCDLEICCRELNDYKRAYEYSNSKISLLQKMLT